MQLELKLFASYRSVAFYVTVSTTAGLTIRGQSVEIFTHNSGGPEYVFFIHQITSQLVSFPLKSTSHAKKKPERTNPPLGALSLHLTYFCF